jgi:hypothetical protein
VASATVRWFHSPSENIECQVAAADPRGTNVYCQTGTPALHVVLHANGRLDRCNGVQCLGNGPVTATTLAYGRSVVVGPFRCTSLRIGMRCVVRSTGHGFLLSRAGVKRL